MAHRKRFRNPRHQQQYEALLDRPPIIYTPGHGDQCNVGASIFGAFWKGYLGVRRLDGKIPHTLGSANHFCYRAGEDYRRDMGDIWVARAEWAFRGHKGIPPRENAWDRLDRCIIGQDRV